MQCQRYSEQQFRELAIIDDTITVRIPSEYKFTSRARYSLSFAILRHFTFEFTRIVADTSPTNASQLFRYDSRTMIRRIVA